MKSITVFISIFVAQFAFALNLEGTLEVKDSLRVKREDGFKARFYKGSYKTQLWNVGKSDMSIRIEKNGAYTDVPVKVPSTHKIPAQGSFQIPGNVCDQTFDLSGNTKTVTEQTEPERNFEPCVYYRDEWVCYGRGRHRRCRWETVAVQGQMEVEFYFKTTKFSLALNLQSAGDEPAQFAGSKTSRDKVYTYRGECY